MSRWCPINFSGSKVCSHDWNENKQRARNVPWLQQTFAGEEDCVTRPKNVCAGGFHDYHAYSLEMMVVVSCTHNQSLVYLLANCDKVIKHSADAVSVLSHNDTATIF